MPQPLQFTDAEIQAEAVRLGVIKAGEALPRNQRSRVVASLAAEKQRPAAGAKVPLARQITVQPGGDILIDGKPFPWVVLADRMEVALEHDGTGTVRLTVPAESIQILPKNESESRA